MCRRGSPKCVVVKSVEVLAVEDGFIINQVDCKEEKSRPDKEAEA